MPTLYRHKQGLRRVPRNRNTEDGTGRVRVQIMLIDRGNQHVKGNIVRSFTFARTTVSTVATQLERML